LSEEERTKNIKKEMNKEKEEKTEKNWQLQQNIPNSLSFY